MSSYLRNILSEKEQVLLKQDQQLLDIARDKNLLNDTFKHLEEIKEIFEARIINESNPHKISDEIADKYVIMSKIFWKCGEALDSAINLLLHGSSQFSQWQFNNNHYVSRSTIFSQLTAYYLHIYKDIGAATWWALHTVTDSPGGDNTFISRLGYPQEVIDKLRERRSTYQGEILIESSSKNGDALRQSFTEDIIREFFLKNPQYSNILGNNSQVRSFPICKVYYDILLNSINAHNIKNNNKKGKALERLASYLFMLIPGCIPKNNVMDIDNTHEIDLLILNRHPISNLATELFGRHIIIECKNWKKPVPVEQVSYLLQKVHLMHGSFGVLFAPSNVTGTPKGKSARQLIRRAFHEDHILCVVISLTDLKRISNKEITFHDLLIQLADEFRFGR